MLWCVQGQKMSKTKGNVIDPLVTIAQYGADALRCVYNALFQSNTFLSLVYVAQATGYAVLCRVLAAALLCAPAVMQCGCICVCTVLLRTINVLLRAAH
jgi:tRNA synthetases class I (I, L, M and V)